jgi:hypothetical protein
VYRIIRGKTIGAGITLTPYDIKRETAREKG